MQAFFDAGLHFSAEVRHHHLPKDDDWRNGPAAVPS